MRAVLLNAPGEMSVETTEERALGASEVRVQVAAAGICMGDLHIYNGKNPYAAYPCICGHEISGTVIETGPEVIDLKLGSRVVVEPFIGCGTCWTCRAGKPNCCPNLRILGVHRPGGYAERVVAPRTHIHDVPAELSLASAALTEPVAIGVQAARRGQITAKDIVLVLGCGPIGLAAIEVARARGATVLAADLMPARLESAAGIGVEVFLADASLSEQIRKRTEGQGVSVVVEATGNPEAMALSLELVSHGGRIVILGLVKDGLSVSFKGLDLTRKEPTIVGSRASTDCFPESLALIRDGKISLGKLAIELPMWDAPKIFSDIVKSAPSVQKVLLRI